MLLIWEFWRIFPWFNILIKRNIRVKTFLSHGGKDWIFIGWMIFVPSPIPQLHREQKNAPSPASPGTEKCPIPSFTGNRKMPFSNNKTSPAFLITRKRLADLQRSLDDKNTTKRAVFLKGGSDRKTLCTRTMQNGTRSSSLLRGNEGGGNGEHLRRTLPRTKGNNQKVGREGRGGKKWSVITFETITPVNWG